MIRTLKLQDALAMAELHEKAITPNWPHQDMETHLQRDICIGYGELLSGFIIIQHTMDQAEVLTIVTDPDHRKKGIGRKLLTAGEQVLSQKGADILFLEVAEDNAPAIELYKSCAYEPYGRRPAYYRREKGRVAAVTYRKRLDV